MYKIMSKVLANHIRIVMFMYFREANGFMIKLKTCIMIIIYNKRLFYYVYFQSNKVSIIVNMFNGTIHMN